MSDDDVINIDEARKQRKSLDADARKGDGEGAIALRFVDQHGGFLYVPEYGENFMCWNGVIWKQSRVAICTAIRKFIVNEINAGNYDEKTAERLRGQLHKKSIVWNVRDLCMIDERYAATPDQFDQRPWYLNTPRGVVDLESGKLHPHSPTDYLTRMAAVSPGGTCERFKRFMREITGNDQELIDFLQRALGYALTGSTREHVLFYLYGTGANGKSTLENTLTGILGDYACSSPTEVFLERQFAQHSTELAMLQGARLVTAQEVEQGQHWNESRIKALTGGDPITARFMRQDNVTFPAQFKLFIAGNHKPSLRTVDPAMKRRLILIPFEVEIPEEKRDPDLLDHLQSEWCGILRWLIDGCLEYRRVGLAPPARVLDATAAYFDVQDITQGFFDSYCDVGSDRFEQPTTLYAAWKRYARENEIPIGRPAQFNDRMEERGFKQERKSAGRYWRGIRVKLETMPDADPWSR